MSQACRFCRTVALCSTITQAQLKLIQYGEVAYRIHVEILSEFVHLPWIRFSIQANRTPGRWFSGFKKLPRGGLLFFSLVKTATSGFDNRGLGLGQERANQAQDHVLRANDDFGRTREIGIGRRMLELVLLYAQRFVVIWMVIVGFPKAQPPTPVPHPGRARMFEACYNRAEQFLLLFVYHWNWMGGLRPIASLINKRGIQGRPAD